MADGIFLVFDLFSKISSAACSLIRVLLSVLPSLIGFLMQLCEQVNTREKPGTPAYFGLPCIPMISFTLHGFTKAGCVHLKQTILFLFIGGNFHFNTQMVTETNSLVLLAFLLRDENKNALFCPLKRLQ